MRHNRDDKRFNRNSGHLKCMMANMTRDLLLHDRIKTTTPKAKEVRRSAERMITLSKLGTLSARRRAMAFLRDKAVVTRLFTELGPRFKDRKGGYTRMLKVGVRHGDCAPMSLIELVEGAMDKASKGGEPAKGKKATSKKDKAKKAAPKKEKAKAAPKKEKAKAAPKKEKAKASTKETAKAKPKAKAAPKKEKDEKSPK